MFPLSFNFVHHDQLLYKHHVSRQKYLLLLHSALLKNFLQQLGKLILLCFKFEKHFSALIIDNLLVLSYALSNKTDIQKKNPSLYLKGLMFL